jgi:hypothetical protein
MQLHGEKKILITQVDKHSGFLILTALMDERELSDYKIVYNYNNASTNK